MDLLDILVCLSFIILTIIGLLIVSLPFRIKSTYWKEVAETRDKIKSFHKRNLK